MKILLAIASLVFASPLYTADVYKTVDENGNPVFSDKPSDGAEKIEVEDVLTIPGLRNIPDYDRPIEEEKKYQRLSISSPVQEETYFRGQGDLVISVNVSPRVRGSDRIVYFLDGNEIHSGNSTSFSVSEMDRGTHTIRVAIVAPDGTEYISSQPVVFYMRQASRISP